MKKLTLLLFISIFIFSACSQPFSFTEKNNKKIINNNLSSKSSLANNQYPSSSIATVADKVQVFLFHTTQRCSTCIAIGKLAGETVNERFQDELKSGKIEFREINIDLAENKELAKKFQASGSIFFINNIYNETDHIKSDSKVWRLTSSPDAFKDYLEGLININLGK